MKPIPKHVLATEIGPRRLSQGPPNGFTLPAPWTCPQHRMDRQPARARQAGAQGAARRRGHKFHSIL